MALAVQSLFGDRSFTWGSIDTFISPSSEAEDIDLPDVEHESRFNARAFWTNINSHTTPPSPPPEEEDLDLPDFDDEFESQTSSANRSPPSSPLRDYELREREKYVLLFHSTWIDNDKSGTYDPKKDKTKPRKLLTNRRHYEGVQGRNLEIRSSKKFEGRSLLAARQTGVPCIVSLQLKSEAGRTLLSKHRDHWPEYLNVVEDDDPLGILGRDSGGEATFIPPTRVLRSHLAPGAAGSYEVSVEDAQGDLTGHPENRGCKSCIELRLICPLREDGEAYPCTFCVEADLDCELCQTPNIKRSCENCRRRSKRCSYLDTDNHRSACTNCSNSGFHCVAGPKRGSTRPRISYDNPRRRFVTCDSCRKAKKWCSLRSFPTGTLSGTPPCTRCEDDEVECTFDGIQEASKPANLAVQPSSEPVTPLCTRREDDETECTLNSIQEASKPAVQPSPKPVLTDASSITIKFPPRTPHTSAKRDLHGPVIDLTRDRPCIDLTTDITYHTSTQLRSQSVLVDLTVAGRITTPENGPITETTIYTSLAHPVTFHHVPDKYGGNPCHFCQKTRYGVLGLGRRAVRVALAADGRIEREISGGHTETGHSPSRMCVGCSMARVQICQCTAHRLEDIPGSTEARDFGAALWRLKTLKRVEEEWCSVCPRLAQFRCCAPQEAVSKGHGGKGAGGSVAGSGSEVRKGCGLLLCLVCALRLDERQGELSTLVLAGCGKGEEYPLGLRADAEFLARSGPLMRCFLANL